MKYAIISDIHGNYPALQAVLSDAENRGITHFLFAGDYCISGPFPDESITAIRAISNKTVIRGNEEKYLENLIGKDPAQWTDGQMQISYWTYRNIRRDNLKYVLSLPHAADCGQDVGPCDVGCVDEVHGLLSIAENQRRNAIDDPLHPSDQYLGVKPVHIHPGPVNVEVPKGHVIQPGHGPEAPGHPFVE